MPTVKVKGVANPLSFPDDMDITDIKNVLRNKFTADMIKAPSLSRLPDSVEPYDPSLSEKISQGIASYLLDKGFISDNYRAQEIGKNLSMIAEFLPGIGDATAGDDFGRAVAQGDKLGMGLGAMAAIPVVGDASKYIANQGAANIDAMYDLLSDIGKSVNIGVEKGKKVTNGIAKFTSPYGSTRYVEYVDGKPVSALQVMSMDGKKAKIANVFTIPEEQKKGRASKLMEIARKDFEKVEHSEDLTEQGAAFARSVEGIEGSTEAQSLPIEEVKPITSYNEMFNFTPEQLAQQLRSTRPENVINGVYIEKTKFGEKRFNPDGSIEIIKDGKVFRRFEPQDADMAYKNKIMKNIEDRPDVKAAQEKRKADFDAERERLKRQEQDSYKMQHTAPTREGNSSGFDLTDTFGEDIYSARAKQYYGTGSTYDDKAISIIQSMRGNPDKEVTIYRAVPKSVSDINPSDWVTTTKEYAQDHMAGEKGWHILSKKVKAKDIATDGNSIHEFGYDPE